MPCDLFVHPALFTSDIWIAGLQLLFHDLGGFWCFFAVPWRSRTMQFFLINPDTGMAVFRCFAYAFAERVARWDRANPRRPTTLVLVGGVCFGFIGVVVVGCCCCLSAYAFFGVFQLNRECLVVFAYSGQTSSSGCRWSLLSGLYFSSTLFFSVSVCLSVRIFLICDDIFASRCCRASFCLVHNTTFGYTVKMGMVCVQCFPCRFLLLLFGSLRVRSDMFYTLCSFSHTFTVLCFRWTMFVDHHRPSPERLSQTCQVLR